MLVSYQVMSLEIQIGSTGRIGPPGRSLPTPVLETLEYRAADAK